MFQIHAVDFYSLYRLPTLENPGGCDPQYGTIIPRKPNAYIDCLYKKRCRKKNGEKIA
jgi:hypothetical protein